jgi:hypothetical protein
VDALLHASALKLRDRRQHTSNQPPGRRGRVDTLAERHERDPARLPLVQQQHEMTQVATEPIELPAHDRNGGWWMKRFANTLRDCQMTNASRSSGRRVIAGCDSSRLLIRLLRLRSANQYETVWLGLASMFAGAFAAASAFVLRNGPTTSTVSRLGAVVRPGEMRNPIIRNRMPKIETAAWMDAEAARSHLLKLQAKGIGVRQAALLADVAPATIQAVRSGKAVRIRTTTANAILSVRPIPAASQRYNAYPSKRELLALRQEGYTLRQLAARIGCSRLRIKKRITARRKAQIHRLFSKMNE